MKVTIDPEFEALLPECNEHENEMLEANLLASGGPDESIKVWREGGNAIIDGHRRFKACEKHGLHYDVEEMTFPDRQAVKEWMLLRQRSKRNLSDLDRVRIDVELVRLEQAKQSSAPMSKVAKATNQSVSNVSRSVKAAKVLESLPKDAKTKITSGEISASRNSLNQLADLPERQQKKAAKEISKGKFKTLAEALSASGHVKTKVERADATLPENYVDDYGTAVPKDLYPVWRKKGEYLRLCNELRKVAGEVQKLGKELECEATASVGDDVDALRKSLAGMAPALIKAGRWFSKSFAEAHGGKKNG